MHVAQAAAGFCLSVFLLSSSAPLLAQDFRDTRQMDRDEQLQIQSPQTLRDTRQMDRDEQLQIQSPQTLRAPERALPACNGPDPAAFLSQTSGRPGMVTYRFEVRNVGRADFVSSPEQQGVLIYQNDRHTHTYPFQNLRVGQSRVWTLTMPAAGAPAEIRMLITYDPDIFIDGNPRNDDCNLYNNSASLRTRR